MEPEHVGALAEVIAAAAVVASLVYVARQVRQAGQHARLMALQAVAAQMNSHFDMTASTADNARIWNRGLLHGMSALREDEAFQFGQLLGRFLKNYEELIRYRHEGIVDERRLSGLELGYLGALPTPGFKDFWKLYATFFSQEFRAHIDEKMQEAERLIDLAALDAEYKKPVGPSNAGSE